LREESLLKKDYDFYELELTFVLKRCSVVSLWLAVAEKRREMTVKGGKRLTVYP